MGFRRLAAVSRIPVLGRVPWMIFPRLLDLAMRSRLPVDRHDDLIAEMRRTDMAVFRQMVKEYFDHLDRYGSLVDPARVHGSTRHGRSAHAFFQCPVHRRVRMP